MCRTGLVDDETPEQARHATALRASPTAAKIAAFGARAAENHNVDEDSIPRRFGPDFVAEHRRRYGKRPPEGQQLTYDIAVEDEYARGRGQPISPWKEKLG